MRCCRFAIFLMLFASSYCIAQAQEVILPFVARGNYRSDGGFVNGNYLTGDYRGRPCPCDADYRDFFVFDLGWLTQPITAATLELGLPNDSQGSFQSPHGTETFVLHDVTTPITPIIDGNGGVTAHTDFGDGAVYGSRAITSADNGTVVQIPLNSAAIANLEAAPGLFAMGGSVSTLDNTSNTIEMIFAYSGGSSVTRLRLTVVPEPSTFALLVFSGALFAGPFTRRS